MKKLVLLFALAFSLSLLVLVVYQKNDDSPIVHITPEDGVQIHDSEQTGKTDIDQALDTIKDQIDQVAAAEPDALSYEEKAQLLNEAKVQLDELILDYHDNINEPEYKDLTQAKIEALLNQYNQLALPIALAKINENK